MATRKLKGAYPGYDQVRRGRPGSSMRRFLIGLTLAVLVLVSAAIGIAVALWPKWRHLLN